MGVRIDDLPFPEPGSLQFAQFLARQIAVAQNLPEDSLANRLGSVDR